MVEELAKELGAFGVVSATLLLVVRWMLSRFTSEMRTHTALLASIQKSMIIFTSMLIRHDSQVRGVNPSLDPQQEQRDREAIRIYLELQDQLKRFEEDISRAVGEIKHD